MIRSSPSLVSLPCCVTKEGGDRLSPSVPKRPKDKHRQSGDALALPFGTSLSDQSSVQPTKRSAGVRAAALNKRKGEARLVQYALLHLLQLREVQMLVEPAVSQAGSAALRGGTLMLPQLNSNSNRSIQSQGRCKTNSHGGGTRYLGPL